MAKHRVLDYPTAAPHSDGRVDGNGGGGTARRGGTEARA